MRPVGSVGSLQHVHVVHLLALGTILPGLRWRVLAGPGTKDIGQRWAEHRDNGDADRSGQLGHRRVRTQIGVGAA